MQVVYQICKHQYAELLSCDERFSLAILNKMNVIFNNAINMEPWPVFSNFSINLFSNFQTDSSLHVMMGFNGIAISCIAFPALRILIFVF